MTVLQIAQGIGAGVHALAALVFFALMVTQKNNYTVRYIYNSAFVVTLVTATVNAAQVSLVDVHFNYVLTWASYSVSLLFIGLSLGVFVGSSGVPAFLLSTVGLGGVLGLLLDGGSPSFWFVMVGTTLLYIGFAVMLFSFAEREERPLIIVFLLATLLYIVPYLIGYPRTRVTADISVGWEQVAYLIGNIVTKIIVPLWEAALFNNRLSVSVAAPSITARSSVTDSLLHFKV